MSAHLIIDGNAVYEVDEECMRRRYGRVEIWGMPVSQGREQEFINSRENKRQKSEEKKKKKKGAAKELAAREPEDGFSSRIRRHCRRSTEE